MRGKATSLRSVSEVETLVGEKATGRLIGGNLSIFSSTPGTPYQADFENALLFIEDIGEDTYKINRMLALLEQAGLLREISGLLILGKCTDCSARTQPAFALMEVLDHYLLRYNIPTVYNQDFGHEPDNFTILVGAMAELDASAGLITLTQPAVR